MTHERRGGPIHILVTVGLLTLCAVSVRATTITIVNDDAAGEGFNDPSPRTPVGGNTGTTLGQQRLLAFQYAANVWAGVINSSVEIRVSAHFGPLDCAATSAMLGMAGPLSVSRDFDGAPLPGTFYPAALANSLAGVDLEPDSDDIEAHFNSELDSGCLTARPNGWYYGFDGNPGAGQIDLQITLLHELAHGLGFLTFVNLSTGEKFLGFDDVFMRNLEDHTTGKLYPLMTNAERVAASMKDGNLHWVGSNVRASSGVLTAGRTGDHVHMYAPNPQEEGSSVSHFDTALSPDELLEPYMRPHPLKTLAEELLKDIGWSESDAAGECVGDCNEDGSVTVDEITTLANVALGKVDMHDCMRGDLNHDGRCTVDEVVAAVNSALRACGSTAATPTVPPPTPTPPHTTPTAGHPTPTAPAHSCPFDFQDPVDASAGACIYQGTWNQSCGDDQLQAYWETGTLEYRNGQTAPGVRVTFPELSPPVYMLAQVTSSIRATLVGVFADPSQIHALTGSLVLRGFTGLVITPDTPPIAINQCAFARYTGTCTGMTSSGADATASDATADTNASLLTAMPMRFAVRFHELSGR